jgi:hypothetical protein
VLLLLLLRPVRLLQYCTLCEPISKLTTATCSAAIPTPPSPHSPHPTQVNILEVVLREIRATWIDPMTNLLRVWANNMDPGELGYALHYTVYAALSCCGTVTCTIVMCFLSAAARGGVIFFILPFTYVLTRLCHGGGCTGEREYSLRLCGMRPVLSV